MYHIIVKHQYYDTIFIMGYLRLLSQEQVSGEIDIPKKIDKSSNNTTLYVFLGLLGFCLLLCLYKCIKSWYEKPADDSPESDNDYDTDKEIGYVTPLKKTTKTIIKNPIVSKN